MPDLHFPWVNLDKLERVIEVVAEEGPDCVVQVGDVYDQYMFGRHRKDLSLISPMAEMEAARVMAGNFWKAIESASRGCRKVMLSGNHDMRFIKGIFDNYPYIAHELMGMKEKYYKFDNVEWHYSDRDYIEIDGVIYCHGWKTRGSHANHFKKSVVHGHSHKANLIYAPLAETEFEPLWDMDLGCIVDEGEGPFNYTPSKITGWSGVVGVIEDGIPRVVKL